MTCLEETDVLKKKAEVMKMTIEILARRHAVSHKYFKYGYNCACGRTDELLHKYTRTIHSQHCITGLTSKILQLCFEMYHDALYINEGKDEQVMQATHGNLVQRNVKSNFVTFEAEKWPQRNVFFPSHEM